MIRTSFHDKFVENSKQSQILLPLWFSIDRGTKRTINKKWRRNEFMGLTRQPIRRRFDQFESMENSITSHVLFQIIRKM
jgi:hypothetical protein